MTETVNSAVALARLPRASAFLDHPVGSQLTAVKNGRVYRGGYLHQGPIHNLFLTEQAAKQIYPDVFGDVTDDAELFDRQRVADIVNGDF